jgi:hypothetical protein
MGFFYGRRAAREALEFNFCGFQKFIIQNNEDDERREASLESGVYDHATCKAPLLSLGHLAQKGRNESHIL